MEEQAEADRRIERENIGAWDWAHAERYCRFYLEHALYDLSKTYHDEARAFTTAIVVTYSRPFSGNRARDGQRDPIDEEYLQALDRHGCALHERMLELRNTAFAHSDAAFHNVQIGDTERGGITTLSQDPLVPLERRDVEGLVANIEVFRVVNERLLSNALAARLAKPSGKK